jgi:excisionase family DNA binding protein
MEQCKPTSRTNRKSSGLTTEQTANHDALAADIKQLPLDRNVEPQKEMKKSGAKERAEQKKAKREQLLQQLSTERHFSGEEVCGILQISSSTLRRLRIQGLISSIKVGPRFVRYPASDVKKLLKTDLDSHPAEYLTVSETANLLGISKVTLRKRIADGSIEALRVGSGSYRILRTEVARILEKGTST